MSKEIPSLAIVGKNLYSCVAALHLRDHFGSKMAWFQTLKDPELGSNDQYLVLTPQQRNQIKIPLFGAGEVLSDNPQIFIGGHRHYPIDHVLKFLRNDLTDCPYLRRNHPSVLAKCIAAGLWNDLSPAVLDAAASPRPNWIKENPATSKEWESGAFSIIRREQLFKATEEKLREKKVQVDFDKKRVLGVDRSSFHQGTRLIFNAPYGSAEYQALLWTSFLYSIKDEGEKKKQPDLSTAAQSVGFWKTFSCEIETRFVSFLPLLSIWIPDDSVGDEFRSSGLMQSGAIRKVTAVPIPDSDRTHLQIQALHFYDNPRDYQRPDEFLWKYCPYLKSQNLDFKKSRAEENLVFRSPFSCHMRISNRFDFWLGGIDCSFAKVPQYQWGIDKRRQKRPESSDGTQSDSAQV